MHTVRDIRKRFGVAEATVLGWIKSGELKATNVGREPGKKKPRWRVSAESLAAFEALRASGSPVGAPSRKRKAKRPAGDVIEFY